MTSAIRSRLPEGRGVLSRGEAWRVVVGALIVGALVFALVAQNWATAIAMTLLLGLVIADYSRVRLARREAHRPDR
jgi:hypothetical protein